MTKIAILPEEVESGRLAYRAISGEKQSVGKTAGEALDALASSLPKEDSGTLVIVQNFRPDHFFTEEQRRRLEELMTRWRNARDSGNKLTHSEQAELDELIQTEVQGASERTAAVLREMQG